MGYFNANPELLNKVVGHIKEFPYNLWDDAIAEIANALGEIKDKEAGCPASKFMFADLKSHCHNILHEDDCEYFVEKNENIEVV